MKRRKYVSEKKAIFGKQKKIFYTFSFICNCTIKNIVYQPLFSWGSKFPTWICGLIINCIICIPIRNNLHSKLIIDTDSSNSIADPWFSTSAFHHKSKVFPWSINGRDYFASHQLSWGCRKFANSEVLQRCLLYLLQGGSPPCRFGDCPLCIPVRCP